MMKNIFVEKKMNKHTYELYINISIATATENP